MATVNEIYAFVDQLAPFSYQMSFDNAGFLVGRGGRQVTRILVSLDITEEVVREASEWKAELIVSHHPVIFHPARSVTDQDPTGRILLALAEDGIAAVCAHTNLDAVADDMDASDDECFEITTTPDGFGTVLAALEEKGYSFVSAKVEMVPQNYVKLESEEDIKNMEKLIDLLEENEDVQNVYHNWEQE